MWGVPTYAHSSSTNVAGACSLPSEPVPSAVTSIPCPGPMRAVRARSTWTPCGILHGAAVLPELTGCGRSIRDEPAQGVSVPLACRSTVCAASTACSFLVAALARHVGDGWLAPACAAPASAGPEGSLGLSPAWPGWRCQVLGAGRVPPAGTRSCCCSWPGSRLAPVT